MSKKADFGLFWTIVELYINLTKKHAKGKVYFGPYGKAEKAQKIY